MILLLSLISFYTADPNEKNLLSDQSEIKKVIQLFIESGDERNIEKSDQSLHKDFSQYLDFMGKGISRSTKADYEAMLKAGKIGGEKRSYTVNSIDVNSTIAYAKVTVESKSLRFHDILSLMKEQGKWKIVSLSLRVDAK